MSTVCVCILSGLTDLASDIFFGLNVVRFLSIVSLILVFASSIFVIVTDVEAVNAFESAKQSGNVTAQDFADCEYIE